MAVITDHDGQRGAMEIRQLRYFVAAAEAGGFGRAARNLHIVQAAVSQQIQRLERELGVRLFDRTSRQIQLTPAGERLLPEAYAVIAAVERTQRVATELAAGQRRTLRIGIGRAFDVRVRRFLDQAALRDPELTVHEVRGSHNERLTGLRNGELDAAILRASGPLPDLCRATLWTEPLLAAFPDEHPAAELDSVRLEQFSALPLRLAPRTANPLFHDLVLHACAEAGFEPVRGPEFTGLQQVLHEIGQDGKAWTVFYPIGEPAPTPGVAIRPVADHTIDVDLVYASADERLIPLVGQGEPRSGSASCQVAD